MYKGSTTKTIRISTCPNNWRRRCGLRIVELPQLARFTSDCSAEVFAASARLDQQCVGCDIRRSHDICMSADASVWYASVCCLRQLSWRLRRVAARQVRLYRAQPEHSLCIRQNLQPRTAAAHVQEGDFETANRMFFLAIPPGVFVSAARGSGGAAASQCAPLPSLRLVTCTHMTACILRWLKNHLGYGEDLAARLRTSLCLPGCC